jgi:hypothetical protein
LISISTVDLSAKNTKFEIHALRPNFHDTMKKIFPFIFLILACNSESKKTNLSKEDFVTVFETSDGKETATYFEIISFYKDLERSFDQVSIKTMDETDSGYPLHLVTFNPKATGDNFADLREDIRLILINNGIHPGEPDGIDATMLLFRDLGLGLVPVPENTIICAIPVYNIGGCLNRNSTSRTNQNGPKAYGFRGNARNYDLNRDFIKSDTKNARAFAKLFHEVRPDVFIDNHVSNGADYQYTLTHLFTQHNKLGGKLGSYLHKSIMPKLETKLKEKSWDITPYVNVFNRQPETGFSQFFDSPRYSTGYTTLFNTLGMMVETHMLKPYDRRVKGTYELMLSMLEIVEENGLEMRQARMENSNNWKVGDEYPIQWELDTSKVSTLMFKGYEGEFIPSALTGAKRLKFNRSKPFTKEVIYKNYFKPKQKVVIPSAYVIPKGWHNIIDLLKLNGAKLDPIEKDTIIQVGAYRIENYKTRQNPYEGHYPHYDTATSTSNIEIAFQKGDIIVSTNQPAMRYLIETLEPSATDSFFNWNFFDTILQQKEGFSPYVWEDKAQMLLKMNPKLQIEYNLKKSYNKDFAENWYAQLEWLHKNSPHYEKAHLRYPIYRLK